MIGTARKSSIGSFFPTMLRMVMRYTQDRELAMEIVNTGFLRVFQKLDTFSFKGSLEGWVRRLVFHALSDHFRRKKEPVYFLDIEDRDAPVRSDALSKLYFEDILSLVEKLPPASKEVFLAVRRGGIYPRGNCRTGWH